MGGGFGAPVPVAVRVQDLAPGRALAQHGQGLPPSEAVRLPRQEHPAERSPPMVLGRLSPSSGGNIPEAAGMGGRLGPSLSAPGEGDGAE